MSNIIILEEIMQEKNHLLSVEETLKLYETDKKAGLNSQEIKERQEKYGLNQLEEAKKRPLILKLLDQFKDFMIIILLIAALISIFVAQELSNGLLIIAIVILNAVLSVIQEAKAEKSTEAIKALSSPHVTVIRDAKEMVIDVKDIVVGDLVLLEAGDYVPADVRIIESINLKADEAALTGEAVPVDKVSETLSGDDIPLGDRINLAYMGTVITYGRGKAIVTKVGMNTEIGKIATMLSQTESDATPLQKNVAVLGKTLAIIALIITGAIFLLEVVQGIIASEDLSDFAWWSDKFMFAVSLAVAAIPEGLPAIITIVLSIGMSNLAKEKAIMRTLPAVETLGSTSIICSDKTGTLTQNVMTVQKVYLNKELLDVQNVSTLSKDLELLVTMGVLVNDTKVQFENDRFVKIGDPTEIAFIDLAINLKKNPIEITQSIDRLHELPFDSERKLMTTVHDIDGVTYAVVKGAPDVIFNKTKNIHNQDTNKDLEHFIKANEDMSNQALRVLAVAYKEIKDPNNLKSLSFADLETDLSLLGLVGMIDPERPEVKDAISICNKAGIKTIMITGDHKNTAMAIAKNLDILTGDAIAITGKELDQLSDNEFASKLSSIRVYARVSPENKVRIVKAWRDTGLVVAMTGDGVNDAPSIKQADIGIAMGITGTEVAKGAADMILTDDNFATIVNAVGGGRTIFANIKKAIHFLLSCNIGEIVAMTLGVLLGAWLFGTSESSHLLSAAQILWVNLVTDSLLAIGIGLEKKEPDVMEYPPRDSSKTIFADGLGKRIAWQGAMVGLLTFSAYFIGFKLHGNDPKAGQTLAFMVLALSQLFHAFNVRSDRFSTFKLRANYWLIGAFFVSLFLQLIVMFITPVAQGLFNVYSIWELPFYYWLIVLVLAVMPLVIIETQKFILNKTRK